MDSLLQDLNQTIERTPKKKKKNNLTHLEVAGLRWCEEKIKSRSLYITRADKSLSMYIFHGETVSSIIVNTLKDETKFTPLPEDPRKSIRSNLNRLLDKCIDEGTILKNERFLITGKTEQDGQSQVTVMIFT